MTTQEENDRLTRVGPSTPMGNLMRRYWHPVGAMEELLEKPVQPVRILGEDLTLFRSLKGEIGLIGRGCAHRGMNLAYGIPQESGLRCAYHGWTYDTTGQLVDTPFEPECLPYKIRAYPVQELGGLIWVYLGPEPVPLLPNLELLVRPELIRDIHFRPLRQCNWLQCMDNSLDPIHFEHLHGHYQNYYNQRHGLPRAMNPARHLKVAFDLYEYGIYKRRLVEGESEENPPDDWTTGHPIFFPNTLVQGAGDSFNYQIRVPVDDTTTMHVFYRGRPRRPEEAPQEVVPVRRSEVHYDEWGLVDEPGIVPQDEMVWIGQGAITNRTRQHLATSD